MGLYCKQYTTELSSSKHTYLLILWSRIVSTVSTTSNNKQKRFEVVDP